MSRSRLPGSEVEGFDLVPVRRLDEALAALLR
jgi:hypothetical protein